MSKKAYGSVCAGIFLLLGICPLGFSQVLYEDDLGEFTGQVSYGGDTSEPSGSKLTDATYEVLASGEDIWGTADGGYFVYKEISGSFEATAHLNWGPQEIPGEDPVVDNEWKKLGLMVREDVEDAGSQHAFAMLRRDLGADLQYRPVAGADSFDTGLQSKRPGETNWVKLVRVGDTFTMYRGTVDGGYQAIGMTSIADFNDDAFVGLAVTAHDNNNVERGWFGNVSIRQLAVGVIGTRTLPDTTLDAGSSVAGVVVSVTVEEGQTANLTVTETIPAGWTASNLNASAGTATISGATITWTLPNATGPAATLTYDVVVSNTLGDALFNGTILAGTDTFVIGGDSRVNVLPPSTTLGVFDESQDVFNTEATLGAEGDARYDGNTDTYIVIGSGHDIWDAADDFHFLYKEFTGDASLKADVNLEVGGGEVTWAKAGLMVRDSLSADSPFAFAMIRNQGFDFGPQYRTDYGVNAEWEGDAAFVFGGTEEGQQSGTVEITFDAETNLVTFYYYDAATGERVEWRTLDTVFFEEENYIGLAVTSHSTGNLSTGRFTDVELTINGEPVGVLDWDLY